MRGHPLALLDLASTVLNITDQRNRNPFTEIEHQPAVGDVVATFLDVPGPETSALLHALAFLTDDELLRARITRELARRDDRPPAWSGPERPRITGVTEMVHILGDGDDVIIGVRLGDGQELSVVVYIDHNLGTVVKGAFTVPTGTKALLAMMQSEAEPDTTFVALDPADARARLAGAIDHGARTFPPHETDEWPACRPLVEWVARMLPEGGATYTRPEWSEEEQQALAERFFASPMAMGFDDEDHRELLDHLLWFGTGYGPGDPMRWSPVNVEIVLLDWFPRKIVAKAAFLAKLPDLLSAFVRFCHAERGIRKVLTDDTLASLRRWHPEYQRMIRTPRHQGPIALLDAMGVLADDEEPLGDWDEDDELPLPEFLRKMLVLEVGSEDVIDSIDIEPLPDEPFPWDLVGDDERDIVSYLVERCDRFADEVLGSEFRTAIHRFVARVVAGDNTVLDRGARPERTAASICWAVASANGRMGTSGDLTGKDLGAWFGIGSGSVSQRGQVLIKAAGLTRTPYGGLGTPELLVSAHRRTLVARLERIASLT